jgi:hypothetical protein
MENLDIIIFSLIVAVSFIIFIVTCIKEFTKMEKVEYTYNPKKRKFGRDGIYDMIERWFDDTTTDKVDRANLIKTIDRTIADMESDGVYFSDEVKEMLEKEKQDLFCEYSGLPSVKSYEKN